MASELIENLLTLVPALPGCYIMKNADDQIIYIGKAKNLKIVSVLISSRPILGRRLSLSVRLTILTILSRKRIKRVCCWRLI